MSVFHCGECGKQTDERQAANVEEILVCFNCEEKLFNNLEEDEEKND